MSESFSGPEQAEEMITELNRVDNTIGGILLLGVIMFFLVGGLLAKSGVDLFVVVGVLFVGLMLLLTRIFLVRKGRQVVMDKYGLSCNKCKKTPRLNVDARQALRTRCCPHCDSHYLD